MHFVNGLVSWLFLSAKQTQPQTITGPDTLDSISEGTGQKTRTATYSATDAENDAFVWTVSGTGFTISQAGRLTFSVTDPDFETTPSSAYDSDDHCD